MYTLKSCKADMLQLWGELARTGECDKLEAAAAISYGFLMKIASQDAECPCCEYDAWFLGACISCPIWKKTGDCASAEYGKWAESKTKVGRQYWANKILVLAFMIRA